MLSEGVKQGEIASMLGITEGRVSRIKRKAIQGNLITKDGKVTRGGMQFIQATEN